jgi:CRP-like cAMP-binding protein
LWEILQNYNLFSGLSAEEIKNALEKIPHKMTSYAKGEVIALEGSPCMEIGLVLEGQVDVSGLTPSGRSITIETLGPGHVFGAVMLFLEQNSYPATVIASSRSRVLFIGKAEMMRLLMSSENIAEGFLRMFAEKILMLNKKVKILSCHGVRQKIACFLLDEYQRQGKLCLEFKGSRMQMAEMLGLPRPSLSRELMNMKRDGLIQPEKDYIDIIDPEALQKCLDE